MITRPCWQATRPIAGRPDDNVAQVHVELCMPLFLQVVCKQAGIGPVVELLILLQWHTVSDSADAIGMPCTSARSIQRQPFLTNQTGLPGQKTQRTDEGMHTLVKSLGSSLRVLLWVAGQPPDAVRHLRGPPESRPLSALKLLSVAAVVYSVRPLSESCKNYCSSAKQLLSVF